MSAEVVWIVARLRCSAGHEFEMRRPPLIAIGGCGGHGPEEYCYCDPAEVVVEFVCPQCPSVRPAQRASV